MTETSDFTSGYAPLGTFRLLALLPLLDAEIETATKTVEMYAKAEEHSRVSALKVADALESLVARTTAELQKAALGSDEQDTVARACHNAVAQAQAFRAAADDKGESAAYLTAMTDMMTYLGDLMARRTWVRNEINRRGLLPNSVPAAAAVVYAEAAPAAPAEQYV